MNVEWGYGRESADCPVCGHAGESSVVLAADAVVRDQGRVTLLRCAGCGAGFLRDVVVPRYEDATPAASGMSTDYYVEQGAGIDAMASLLLRFPPRPPRRLLEVGCGYGFALDFARAALGWAVQGVDPSPLASQGSMALDAPVAHEYLSETTPIGDGFDVVLASEVLEHVGDPPAFLATVRRRMSPEGILVLTTPNLSAANPSTPEGPLGRILSPGFHLVLFDRDSLQRLLARAGFASVRVEESSHSLVAFASLAPEGLRVLSDTRPGSDRATLRAYFDARASAAVPGSVLASGFAYRHFKECVNAGSYPEARKSRSRLARVYRERYGIDLEAAARVPAFDGARPFNFTGVLFFSGMLELNGGGAGERAAEYFAAAVTDAEQILANQRAGGLCDGETEDLWWQGRRHLPLALAATQPERALRALADLGGAAAGDGAAPGDVEATRAATFVRLVNAGAYAAAETLAPRVAADLGIETIEAGRLAPERAALDALYCLAMLHLQRGRSAEAAEQFGLARRLAGRSHEADAGDLVRLARTHEGEALRRAGLAAAGADRMRGS